MAQKIYSDLATAFATGKKPTGGDFADLLESCHNDLIKKWTPKANGAFLNPYWFNGTTVLSDNEMDMKIIQLAQHGFTHHFIDIGKCGKDGTLYRAVNTDAGIAADEVAYNSAQLQRWISKAREIDPNSKLIIYFNYAHEWRKRNDALVAGDASIGPGVFNITTFSHGVNDEVKTLLALGFDGVHFDIEHLQNYDADWVTAMTTLRNNTGASTGALVGNKFVSTSIAGDPNFFLPTMFAKFGELMDYVCPMLYDQVYAGSTVTDVATFRQFVLDSIMYLSNGLAGTNCKIQASLPSYLENGTHPLAIETLKDALFSVNNAIGQGAPVAGCSIFYFPDYIGDTTYPKANVLADQVSWIKDWILK